MHFISSTAITLLSAALMARGETFKVMVGRNSTGPALEFFPNQVNAAAGDHIQFIFTGKNHTVTQSSFKDPCTLQFNTATGLAGVDSGFMPVAANASEFPTFEIEVVDAQDPQWFFCNQAKHCNSGMLFAINPPTTGAKTFDAWVALAKTADHPDPALNQTVPFTPPSASASSSSSSSGESATSVDSAAAAATDVPANAAPAPAISETATSSIGRSLSLGTSSPTLQTSAAAAEASSTPNSAPRVTSHASTFFVAFLALAAHSLL
ncbi:hypothetical protein FRC14_000579 [Serendipita sp. 396]|nr:hypothetical protein FRC14_000579 [Serendipita sp. 396]KAG8788932.1 hypothetical protein FRC15_000964 [Serendipita sp. 397]KAG8804121.1 hypothetical protein FRC16_000510 [Serendipita sp. 398]KAG8826044.1 hypothetical protein FRC19_009827 [Serendipita sp. 401]KAG8876866.1 hypothetical protein FRC20_000571 [Serendipita sp. 405]KAG9056834.1 hypothetical protein FS842_009428 [Serendipita sp. 407]